MHVSLLNWNHKIISFSPFIWETMGVDVHQLGLQKKCISWLPIHDANVFPRSYTLIALFFNGSLRKFGFLDRCFVYTEIVALDDCSVDC